MTDMSSPLNKQLAVIYLDFLKAFDRVDKVFNFSALHKLGYTNKFINIIQVVYTNVQSKIKINGLLTEHVIPLCEGFIRGVHLSVVIHYYINLYLRCCLILNDWTHNIRKETSLKFLFKILCFNNKGTTKIKHLQKLPNIDTYFTLQSYGNK